MNLYQRDFSSITEEEKKKWKTIQEEEKVEINGHVSSFKKSLYHKYPKGVKHYLSLFPNNFIDATDLRNDQKRLIKLLTEFEALISKSTTIETDITKFIKEKSTYFIIGSILRNNFQFGHHSLFLFSEFELPPNYKADYLLVGKNSDGHHFVFVELENPYGQITLTDGSYGETIRKGVKQVDDWEVWLDQNFSNLELVFKKALNNSKQLPEEFRNYDKTRIHFVVIAGKREDFNKKTYRLRRNNLQQRNMLVTHYDKLIDYARDIIGQPTY